ncbi:hypothetical protein [Jeotgalibacillus marinus]|uniref:Uncharacterized protein n=1 Tax=Jeotgalibacillus marinus TaxID=86667 RepID=A0ABV3Q4W4_9BACL
MTTEERIQVIRHLSLKYGIDEIIFERMTDSEIRKEYEFEVINILEPFMYRWRGLE